MEKLRNFVKEKLSDELKIILSSWRNDSLNDYLNIWEKAIIYKYSNDGFKELNLITHPPPKAPTNIAIAKSTIAMTIFPLKLVNPPTF